MKIGIFGGSFDPIHKGHIHFARHALKELNLDRIYFVPVKISPLKQDSPIGSASHRVKMIQAAIKTDSRFKVELCEIKRHGPSYTYLTLRYFRKKFSRVEFFLLLGQDALNSFNQWHKWEEICKGAILLIGDRKKMLPYSSTEVRKRLQKGKSIRKECPPVVCSYIKRNKLYV